MFLTLLVPHVKLPSAYWLSLTTEMAQFVTVRSKTISDNIFCTKEKQFLYVVLVVSQSSKLKIRKRKQQAHTHYQNTFVLKTVSETL